MSTGALRPVQHELAPSVELWWMNFDAYRELEQPASLPRVDLLRAERMATEEHAWRFLACRHALYHLLADALGRPPEDVRLTANAFGKPELVDGTLHFNLSHSDAGALFGLSRGAAIGVDVERIRDVVDVEAIAGEHFTSAERAGMRRASSAARARAFLECWTRKEACIKALGTGISIPLSSVDAGYAEKQPRTVPVLLDGCRTDVTVCSVRVPESVAAVALARPEAVDRARRMSGDSAVS